MTSSRKTTQANHRASRSRLAGTLALWWPGLGHLVQGRYSRAVLLLAISIPLARWTADARQYETILACRWNAVAPCFIAAWLGFFAVWALSLSDVRSSNATEARR